MATLIEALRTITLLAELPEEQLQTIAEFGTEKRYETGDPVIEAGEPANRMFILLEGEIEGRSAQRGLYVARAGEITGKLPHSRMATFTTTIRAVAPVWLLEIPE